jgi:hypothetical protein
VFSWPSLDALASDFNNDAYLKYHAVQPRDACGSKRFVLASNSWLPLEEGVETWCKHRAQQGHTTRL